jgi:hypothetical protein
MVSACSFVGVGIQGIVVPLRSGMTVPTNNLFLSADLNQVTGLLGDGSTTYINTNVTDSDTSQDDVSMSCWISTTTVIQNAVFIGSLYHRHQSTTANFAPKLGNRNPSTNQINVSPNIAIDFFGSSRTGSTNFNYVIDGASGTASRTSVAPIGTDIGVFNLGNATGVYSTARIATYHYGPALTLATLQALQATLISEIAAI